MYLVYYNICMSTKLLKLKEKAISLRQEGFSYGYIKNKLGLKSKGTLSVWFRNVVLSKEAKKKLEKNIQIAVEKGLFSFNDKRTKKIKAENKESYDKGFSSVPKDLNKRDLFLLGIALYWAEGTKAGSDKPSPVFSFSNSDPEMVRVFMRFIREILCIHIKDMSGGIHLYPSTNIPDARNFWSKITDIPNEKFYIITQVSKASKGLKGNKLPYGTLHIRISRRLVFYRIKGMIDGLISNLKL